LATVSSPRGEDVQNQTADMSSAATTLASIRAKALRMVIFSKTWRFRQLINEK
jgi:hypothetical protein